MLPGVDPADGGRRGPVRVGHAERVHQAVAHVGHGDPLRGGHLKRKRTAIILIGFEAETNKHRLFVQRPAAAKFETAFVNLSLLNEKKTKNTFC